MCLLGIVGSLLGVVGSAIWIKGGVFRPDLMEEVRTYSGRNPFQVKAAIVQRWDDVVQLLGGVHGRPRPRRRARA